MTHADRMRGVRATAILRSLRAREAYAAILPKIIGLRDEGWTLRMIADRLNADGDRLRSGKPWNPVQVMRLLKRY